MPDYFDFHHPDKMNFRLIIDRERCKGCELCLGVCPRQVLVISKSLNASGWHFPEIAPDHECAGCRLCAIICPEAAIEIEKITGLRHGALTRLKEGSEFKPLLHQLTALAQRQGHLTRQDIRKVCQPLLDKEEAIDLDDIVLLFKEKGIAVHG